VGDIILSQGSVLHQKIFFNFSLGACLLSTCLSLSSTIKSSSISRGWRRLPRRVSRSSTMKSSSISRARVCAGTRWPPYELPRDQSARPLRRYQIRLLSRRHKGPRHPLLSRRLKLSSMKSRLGRSPSYYVAPYPSARGSDFRRRYSTSSSKSRSSAWLCSRSRSRSLS